MLRLTTEGVKSILIFQRILIAFHCTKCSLVSHVMKQRVKSFTIAFGLNDLREDISNS